MEEYCDDGGLIEQWTSSQMHPDEQHNELDHFLHQHPLKLSEIDNKNLVECEGCDKRIWGRSYCCHPCEFYLHESCTDIPPQICHFMHSCPLTLTISTYGPCKACGLESDKGFLYHCGRCTWGIHYACTLKQLPSTSTNPEAQEQIEAPIHKHPLSIVEKTRKDDAVLCEVCGEVCFGSIYYGCSTCNFYVHKACVEIPRQLYSVYHDCRYFLVLFICPSYNCGACTKRGFGVSYACIRCGFKLHLKCALRFEGKINEDLQLEHVCHSTGALQKKTDCLGCKFPLEEPCSEHPLEVQTPLHPKHTLFLCKTTEPMRCNVCHHELSSGLIFRCDKCDFNCDYKCIYLMPTVQFANHDSHLLTVVDKVYAHVKCNACHKDCVDKPAFRCFECEFVLHLLCGPLPHTIKYDHMHPLTLEDYFTDDNYSEHYCFFCEKKRDPRLPVYICKKCPYIAATDCVMPEVIACLRGERGEHIALRCINRLLNKKNKVIIRESAMEKLESIEIEEVLEVEPSLFLNDIFDCLKEDEQQKSWDTIKTMVEELTCLEDNDMDDDYNEVKYFKGHMVDSSIDSSDKIQLIIDSRHKMTLILSNDDEFNIGLSFSNAEKPFKRFTEKLDSMIDSRDKIKLILSNGKKQVSLFSEKVLIQLIKKLDSSINSRDKMELILSNDEKQVSSYSEKEFTELIEKLDSGIGSRDEMELILWKDEKQLVKYDKYITPRIFIPILEKLINGKHGDITSEFMLDPRVKSICFMYLSELIYSMQTTMVVDIEKDKLQTWWHRTKMLKLAGFKVDFIQDHLMLVARSHFGLRADDFSKETSEKQLSEIKRLKEEVQILTERIEKLEEEHSNHLEYVESATTTPFMVKCFRDAKARKWRPAAYSLL